jgi:hypothetical protein
MACPMQEAWCSLAALPRLRCRADPAAVLTLLCLAPPPAQMANDNLVVEGGKVQRC